MFAVLDHSGPSLLEAGAVARARWFLFLLVLLAVVLLAAGCHNSSRQAAPPVTNNLSAGALQISTSQPRVGYPLEVVTAIGAVAIIGGVMK